MQQRRLFLIILALFLSMLTFLGSTLALQPPAAMAHAYVIGSDPVDGSTINAVPSVIHIFFNADISPISTAHIYSIQGGSLVDVTAAPSHIPPSHPRQLDTLVQTPNALPQGSYEVKWTAVSNDDGHTTYGIIGFNVGFSGLGISGIPTLGPTTSNNLAGIRSFSFLNVLTVIWEWLILAALTFWIGILVMGRFLLTGRERIPTLLERARKHAISLQQFCLFILLSGEVVSMILRDSYLTQALSGSGGLDMTALLQLLTQTNYGYLWIARITLIALALLWLHWISRRRALPIVPEPPQRTMHRTGPLQPRITRDLYAGNTVSLTKERLEIEDRPLIPASSQQDSLIGMLLAGLILLTYALSGEAAQLIEPHISTIMFAWLNFIAQGIWFGGFAYLGYVILPLLSVVETDRQAETLATVLRRFIPLLLGSIGVLLASGLFLSEASIQNVQLLLTDPYGRTFLIQLIILAILLLISFHTVFQLRPKLTRQVLLLHVVDAELPVRRTRQSALEHTRKKMTWIINIQAWLGVGVLLCTALMSFLTPPIIFPNVTYSNPPAPSSTSVVSTQTKQIGDLSVTLQVLPGRAGYTNTIVMTIADAKGVPVTNARVQLDTDMVIMNMGTGHVTMNGPTYIANIDQHTAFSMAGSWTIEVSIQRPSQAPLQGTFQVMIS